MSIARFSFIGIKMVIRYTLTFADGAVYLLFGESFFKDKKVFWQAHQTKTQECLNWIRVKGFPNKAYDHLLDKEQRFTNLIFFKDWFVLHQQVDWPDDLV